MVNKFDIVQDLWCHVKTDTLFSNKTDSTSSGFMRQYLILVWEG